MTELIHKSERVPKKKPQAKRVKRKYDSGVYSGYLFPDANAWYGAASAFDLFGRLNNYNYSRSGREADARGVRGDYYAVARDLWEAVRLFEGEHSLEQLPRQHRLFEPEPSQGRLFDPDETRRAS